MKLVKKSVAPSGALAKYLGAVLPPTLRIHEEYEGYCKATYIVRAGTGGWLRSPMKVAEVYDKKLVLMHPEWFSDVEEAVASYEAVTGREVTLEVWES